MGFAWTFKRVRKETQGPGPVLNKAGVGGGGVHLLEDVLSQAAYSGTKNLGQSKRLEPNAQQGMRRMIGTLCLGTVFTATGSWLPIPKSRVRKSRPLWEGVGNEVAIHRGISL